MSNRLQQLTRHFTSNKRSTIGTKQDEDIVIVSCCRTPITRAKKGGLKDACLEDMLSTVFTEVIQRANISASLIDEICVGNVLTGTAATMTRMASIYSGIPVKTSCYSVNRQCSSGLQALVCIADSITCGNIDVGIAAGVESMTQHYGAQAQPSQLSVVINDDQKSADCLVPMG